MNDYTKLKILGTGSTGKAWLCVSRRTKQQCVVKEVSVVGMSKIRELRVRNCRC